METFSERGHNRFPANIALPLILGGLCAAILGAGLWYARSQRRSMESAAASELSSIADLKIQQILTWRRERVADAALLAKDPLLISGQAGHRIQSWLESFLKLRGYTEVALLDCHGRVRNRAAVGDSPWSGVPSPLIDSALRTGDVEMSELYASPGGSAYLDFVAPVGSPNRVSKGDVVLLRVEASAFLNEIVQAWPTPRATAECLLVRQEGEHIRYINHPSDAPPGFLATTAPMRDDLPAAMAVRGVGGVHDGFDYRGVAAVAALRRIPGTNWALVAKIDAEEIYSPLRQRTHAVTLVVGLLLAGCLTTFGFFWNIERNRSGRREYEAALEREHIAGRYAHLSRYVYDVILLLDQDGRIVEANDRAESVYGYTVEELLGMSIQDLLDPSELADCPNRIAEIMSQGSMLFESIHVRKNGSTLAVEVTCRVVESEGRSLHQSVIRDITERKRAQEALRRAIRAMRVLSAGNQSLVRSTDEVGLYRAICGAVTGMGGYPLAWIGFAEDDQEKSVRIAAGAGKDIKYLESLRVSWADEPHGRGPTGNCIRSGQVSIFNDIEANEDFQPWREKAFLHAFRSAVALPLISNAETIGALNIYAAEPDAFRDEEVGLLKELAGDLSYGIMAHRSRLAQLRTEEALMQSALEFRALFDAANDAIFIADREGHFLEVNQVACERLGYSRDQLLHMTVNEIDSPAWASQQKARLERVVQGGQYLFETAHIARDGAELPVEISSSLFEYRGTSAILCVARDMSERKRLQAEAQKHAVELERAKTIAENASQVKSQFLANMSHEIRTPMNGIIGTSGLLLDTPLTDEQRDYGETIRTSAGALLEIVNDVLDFSKIEAGRMRIECVTFDIVARLEEIGELLASQVRAKNLDYAFEAVVGHRWVNGDAGRIRQILVNLLANAVKFTEHGQVKLRVSERPSTPGKATFFISVTDSGIGIAEEDLPLLFHQFAQLDSSMTKKQQGTGLGLAISQRLAELMNATLTVSSELGKGTEFLLTLPLQLANEPASQTKVEESLHEKVCQRHRRVLLAEDNVVNQKIGMRLLEKCCCRADLASNGKEAVEMAGRFPYDLIFMDCGMPELDGFDATRAIRAAAQNGARIPIVALTAHVMAGTREECLISGMDDYVAKPVTLEAIEQVLLRWSP